MSKSYEAYLSENPIDRFSFYTQHHITILTRVGQEIEDLLDEAVDGDTISHGEFERAYGLFWLWVLGAFEVIRTMFAARKCFSTDIQNSLKASKKRLVQIRTPMAKQEYTRPKENIRGELSVSEFNADTKDFCLSIKDEKYWARALIREFNQLMSSIRPDDIVATIREH